MNEKKDMYQFRLTIGDWSGVDTDTLKISSFSPMPRLKA